MTHSAPGLAQLEPIVAQGDDGRRYRIVEKLGQGGFGNVYRAWAEDDSGVSRQVAIKVLKEDVPEEVAVRFRDEARMLGLVQHRAIVGLVGLVRFEGQLGAVLEYVPGVDLKAVIEDRSPPLRVVLRIVEEVASALNAAYAHPNELTGRPLRLVHRDIKPANVRLTPGGEVRVVDFGGARADFASREAQTRSFLVGSYRYMAPERLDLVDSPRSDVYSLGLVMAELLVGDEIPTPSKHHGQHAAFVEGVREAVEARLHRDPTLQGGGDAPELARKVLALLDAMLDYYPQHRPLAREVELQARALLREMPGPFLREWAEQTVPGLERAQRTDVTPVASRRAVFPQSRDSADLPDPPDLPEEPPSRPPRRELEGPSALQPLAGIAATAPSPRPRTQAPAAKPEPPKGALEALGPTWLAGESWLAGALAGALVAGLAVSLVTHQVRGIERAAPVAAVFRPVAPLPAPVRDWPNPTLGIVGAPPSVGTPSAAPPATPREQPPPMVTSQPSPEPSRKGLFRKKRRPKDK